MKAMPAVLAVLSGVFLVLGIRFKVNRERQLMVWCWFMAPFLLVCGFVLLIYLWTPDAT